MILDITDIKHVSVKSKVKSDLTYIDDTVVKDMYYYPLATKFGVDTDYLPIDANINAKVKQFLVLSVYVTVANDNIGVTMQQVVDNVVVDPWASNKLIWVEALDLLEQELSASMIYDPDNIPVEPTDHANTITWMRS